MGETPLSLEDTVHRIDEDGRFHHKPLGKMTKADLLAAADYERRKAEGRDEPASEEPPVTTLRQEMFDALLEEGFRPAPDNPDRWRRVTNSDD